MEAEINQVGHLSCRAFAWMIFLHFTLILDWELRSFMSSDSAFMLNPNYAQLLIEFQRNGQKIWDRAENIEFVSIHLLYYVFSSFQFFKEFKICMQISIIFDLIFVSYSALSMILIWWKKRKWKSLHLFSERLSSLVVEQGTHKPKVTGSNPVWARHSNLWYVYQQSWSWTNHDWRIREKLDQGEGIREKLRFYLI